MPLSFASILLFSSFLVTPCFLVPYWLAWSEVSVKKKEKLVNTLMCRVRRAVAKDEKTLMTDDGNSLQFT